MHLFLDFSLLKFKFNFNLNSISHLNTYETPNFLERKTRKENFSLKDC